MKIKLRCGDVYDLNLIKKIVDNGNGTIEIVGNFEPQGKYKSIFLFKQSIQNYDELCSNYKFIQKPYFCSLCNKDHVKGKLFKEHLMYRKHDRLIPTNRIVKANIKKLSPLAIRQLERLLSKKKTSKGNAHVYVYEINKLLIVEGVCDEKLFEEQLNEEIPR